jgi:hypothetical protein
MSDLVVVLVAGGDFSQKGAHQGMLSGFIYSGMIEVYRSSSSGK